MIVGCASNVQSNYKMTSKKALIYSEYYFNFGFHNAANVFFRNDSLDKELLYPLKTSASSTKYDYVILEVDPGYWHFDRFEINAASAPNVSSFQNQFESNNFIHDFSYLKDNSIKNDNHKNIGVYAKPGQIYYLGSIFFEGQKIKSLKNRKDILDKKLSSKYKNLDFSKSHSIFEISK
jgi:hypothetical protein